MSLDTDFVPLAPLSSDTRHGVIPLFAENFKTGGIFVTEMFESRMNETYSRIVRYYNSIKFYRCSIIKLVVTAPLSVCVANNLSLCIIVFVFMQRPVMSCMV